MALRKNPKYDIKLHYKRTLKISLILSLFIIIAAFKVAPNFKGVARYSERPPEVPPPFYVPPTAEPTPPPPPKPPIIIDNPTTDETLPDVIFDGTDLNPNANIAKTTVTPPDGKRDDKIEESPIFIIVEEFPQPVGGISRIASRINYPEIAKSVGIQGTVYIQAIVSERGDVENAVVQKGIGGGCDEEALRVIYETKFSPGKQRGKAVKVKLTIPIKFRLQ